MVGRYSPEPVTKNLQLFRPLLRITIYPDHPIKLFPHVIKRNFLRFRSIIFENRAYGKSLLFISGGIGGV